MEKAKAEVSQSTAMGQDGIIPNPKKEVVLTRT